MAAIEIVTGDDAALIVTMKKQQNGRDDASAFAIPGTATIKAAIVTPDHKHKVIGPVTQSETVDSDWANSKLVIAFDSATTGGTPNKYLGRPLTLEVEVDDVGKETFFRTGVKIYKGHA